ncbi:MAG: hypothetical protein U0792_17525 [Gemmataceae bacterium]
MLAKQFLLFAEELLKGPPLQAAMRSAVSRAYYAAHHHAKDFVESAGIVVRKSGETHRDVCLHLSGIGDAELEAVGNDLAALHSDRNEADYDLHLPQLERPANASDRVALARSLMETLDNCRADGVRYARVQAAIKTRHAVLRGLTP